MRRTGQAGDMLVGTPDGMRWEAPEERRNHVPCDDRKCRALYRPETIEEFRAALEHWMNHRHLGGCSHAC